MGKIFQRGYLLLLIVFFSQMNLFSNGVQIDTKVESHKILIGDQVYLEFRVTQKGSDHLVQIQVPEFEQKLTEHIEVLNVNLDSVTENGTEVLLYKLLITSFNEGNHLVPSLPFILEHNGISDTIYSNETYLEVMGVVIDTTNVIRDIKSVEKANLAFRDIILWILLALYLLAGIAGIIWYQYEKKFMKKKPELQKKKPAEPPHIVALRDLDLLKAQKLWQQNQVKEYYSRLTAIIRTYIELNFKIPALEQTTTEILRSFNNSDFRNKINYNDMRELLTLADLVKFAKGEPDPDENVRFLETGYRFVRDTKDINNTNGENHTNN